MEPEGTDRLDQARLPTMPGYSGTPLVQKLGFKPDMLVGIRHAPADFRAALDPWPAGARLTTPASGPLDAIVLFTGDAATLEREFPLAAAALRPAGMLWIAWPKKASKVPTDLFEDRVRAIGVACGLVDVKVCAMTDVWAGLKFVRRLADRPR
jgi:hypothetical protein